MEKPLSLQALERKIAEFTVSGKPDANQKISIHLCFLGLEYMKSGQIEEAIKAYRKAIDMRPDLPGVHNDLANVFHKTGRFAEAAECYLAALKICPTCSPSLQNLATIRYEQKKFEEAERLCHKAIETSTVDCPSAHLILAKIANDRGDYKASQQHFAASMRSSDGESSTQADSNGKKSSKFDPKALTPFQVRSEKICKAIRSLRDDLKLNPTDASAIGRLYTCLQICCDWKDYDDRMKKLSDLIEDQLDKNWDPHVNEFSVNFFPLSLQQHLAIATYFSQRSIKESIEPPIQYRLSGKQLRIGYVLTGLSKFPLIANRSKFNSDQFEVFYYCLFTKPTLQETLVGPWNDHVIDLTLSDNLKAAVNRIVSNGIQILVKVEGDDFYESTYQDETANAVVGQRPAPIQVVYRTVLGSTGASYIDYFITDKVASPLQFANGYSEKLAYMPNGMFACDNRKLLIKPQANPSEKAKLRRRFHLPESAIVFGVKSHSYKVDPETFECWCEILSEVHGSVIWIFEIYLDEPKSNLKKEAKRHKVNPHRLIFVDDQFKSATLATVPMEDLIDVILDTPMCNAFDLMDHLCKGIPVVTLPRETFQSRLTASMLTSISCEELIAKSTCEYIEIATNLGNNPELLAEMKAKMSEVLPDSNLFRIDQYVNDVENLYEKMWKWREMGEQPEHIVCGNPFPLPCLL